MSKYFLVNPKKGSVDKGILADIEKEKLDISFASEVSKNTESSQKLSEQENLLYVENRIIVKVDMEFKNSHKFSNGLVIRRERKYNEFNRRITQPVNCIAISSSSIPAGSEILIYHNALHETNRIVDYKNSFENENSDRIRYYSIPEGECFAWREPKGEYQPVRNYEFGLRVFRPYSGMIQGIDPALIKDVLFVMTGSLKGNVVHTLKASDYEIIYQNDDGQEGSLIRFRHSEDENFEREEVLAVNHNLTQQVKESKLLVGISVKDAKNIL